MQTLAEFEQKHFILNAQEKRLLADCVVGTRCEISSRRPKNAKEFGDQANVIRAAFIRWLALGGDLTNVVHPKGINLFGGWIEGELDLFCVSVNVPISLFFCHFESVLNLKDMKLNGNLILSGSYLQQGLKADRCIINGSIFLRSENEQRFISNDVVRLLGASIDGSLDCSGAMFNNTSDSFALSIDRAKISDSVFLRANINYIFESDDCIRLLLSEINGDLDCSGASIQARSTSNAISADRARVAGSIFFRERGIHRFKSIGDIRLLGIRIEGDLDCTGAHITGVSKEFSLNAQGARIDGNVIFEASKNYRFESTGGLRVSGAKIGVDFTASGAKLVAHPGQESLYLDGTEVGGCVFLCANSSNRFESVGEIRLLGIKIGADLSCGGALLNSSTSKYALSADRITVEGSVFLNYGGCLFESKGAIRFHGANILGDFTIDDAHLDANGAEFAIDADSANISKNLHLINLYSSGEVKFISVNVSGTLTLENTSNKINNLDLSQAKVGFLQTQPSYWGEGLQLDGFVYDGLRESSWSSKDYLEWLKKQVPSKYGSKDNPQAFKPQPWKQLISVLRKMGHDDVASDIAIAFEQRRYDIGKVGSYQKIELVDGEKLILVLLRNIGRKTNHLIVKVLHKLFGWLAGYGYKPMRLLWWMLGVWLFSATMYFCAAYHGIFTPSDPLIFQNSAYEAACRSYNQDGTARVINNADKNGNTYNWYTCGALVGEYTTFSPVAYSLDVILPLVDLGQEKTWGVYIATPKANGIDELFGHGGRNHAVRFIVWCEILFGWIASLMLVAVFTGLTERDKS